jgi:hypothetical protein
VSALPRNRGRLFVLLCALGLGLPAGQALAVTAAPAAGSAGAAASAMPGQDEATDCDLGTLSMSLAPGPGKVQLEAVDAQDRAPLARAARDGCLKVVAMLVRGGASLDRADAHGWTALHEAASHRHAEVVDFLLAHGAEQERRTNLGETPLALALAGSREQVGPPGDLHTTEMVLLSGHPRQKIDVAAKAPVMPASRTGKKRPLAKAATRHASRPASKPAAKAAAVGTSR